MIVRHRHIARMTGCPLLLAGVILLTGCSKDSGEEPVPEQKQVITFSGRLQEETTVTRAGLEEKLDNKTFQVWGYKNDGYDNATQSYTSFQAVMPDFTVNWIANTAYTTTTNTNDWEYVGQGPDQTIKYWDMSANAYRFFGYAIGNATADPATQPASVTTATTANAVTFSAIVDGSTQAAFDAAPYFSRMWFSTGNPTDYPDRQFGQPVQLQFLKPFARVRFMFTFVDGLTATSADLLAPSFGPATAGKMIATEGTVTVRYPLMDTDIQETWTAAPTAGTGYTTFSVPEIWYYVLPATAHQQGNYAVSVQIRGGDPQTAVVPADYMSWTAGYEYTYKFKITKEGTLLFDIIQAGINDWTSKGADDNTFYNW